MAGMGLRVQKLERSAKARKEQTADLASKVVPRPTTCIRLGATVAYEYRRCKNYPILPSLSYLSPISPPKMRCLRTLYEDKSAKLLKTVVSRAGFEPATH